MARRMYGTLVTETAAEEVARDSSSVVVSEPAKESFFRQLWFKRLCLILGIVACAVLIVVIVLYIKIVVVDHGYGYDEPNELAVAYLESYNMRPNGENALQSEYNDVVLKFFPREVRYYGFGTGAHLDDLKRLEAIQDISFIETEIADIKDVSDRISDMKEGIRKVYGVDMKISDAKLVTVNTKMVWSAEGNAYGMNISLEIPVIKCGWRKKWFLYTGTAIFPCEDIVIEDLEEVGQNDVPVPEITQMPDPTPEPAKIVVKEVPDVDAYKGAYNDLWAGFVKLNGNELSIPVECKRVADAGLFDIDVSSLSDGARVLKSNMISMDVPIKMVDSLYSEMPIRVDVGNPNKERCDITEGLITTLYIAKPADETKDYFDMFLPGNITFGTRLSDVKKVYGEDLTYIKGKDFEPVYELELEEVEAYRKSYNSWVVTIDGEEVKMTDSEYNKYFAEITKSNEEKQRKYDAYLDLLNDPLGQDLVLYSDDALVYMAEIDMNNRIYLQFVNKELVAVEWRYYDLRPFSDAEENNAE